MARYRSANRTTWDALREWLPDKEWVLLPEVRNGAGFQSSNSADAIAVNYWPSRGMPVWGFEFKASRSDWLRELKQPAKAEAMIRFCNRWWVLAEGMSIVADDELPDGWGLLICVDGRIKKVREAENLGNKELTRAFTINLLRRAAEFVVPPAATEEALAEARRQGAEHAEGVNIAVQQELDGLQKVCAEFERNSGIRLDRYTWHAPALGRAAKMLVDAHPAETINNLIVACERAIEAAKLSRDIVSEVFRKESDDDKENHQRSRRNPTP